MTQKQIFKWLPIAVFSLMVAMTAATPLFADSAFDIGGVYTSPREVAKAQAILVQMGDLSRGSFRDGVVDPPTAEALRVFQGRHGLRDTGVVDYETMALLTSHFLPGDADGDWVTDALDHCPSTPEGAEVDQHGCPEDFDGDGVPNGLDGCPRTPKGAQVDSRGCSGDADGDKVADGIDQCADTPPGAAVDAQGCPADSDQDGIYDGIDDCRTTPAGTKVDSRGCPELVRSADIFQGERKLVLKGVNFETNSAKLTSDSRKILDHVAFSLKDWPEVRVEIGGYTDSSGAETHNQELSQARAEAVRDFLVNQGIDASRLDAKGYGESDPISSNDSARGRAQNRRVELAKIE